MSAAELPDYYLVIDLEATCDDGDRMPREETEIIEIGAVLVAAGDLLPKGEFQTFVKPVRHPLLTAFCQSLTTIAQADVDHAPGFAAAIDALTTFIAGRSALFCSWGQYDKSQLERDAAYHHTGLPFGAAHMNIKKRFSAELGDRRRLGMNEALARVGLTLEGTHHRGIDDARNIARLLPWALGRLNG